MNLINQLKPNSTKFIAIIAVFFFVLTIVVRLPFFFRDVIDWDEGTYILIGKSFLDGYSPERGNDSGISNCSFLFPLFGNIFRCFVRIQVSQTQS